MAEGTYEYECMRAELLGVATPDYEQFLQRKQEEIDANPDGEAVENDEITTDPEEAPAQEEGAQEQKASKLEELNNMISPVISITQKKIDSFKIRCGSVSDMIKTKIGSISGASGSNAETAEGAGTEIANNGDAKKGEETNIL